VVTIGTTWNKEKADRSYPIIGDNVWISAGAKIIGPVSIGDDTIIGANAVVVKDIPERCVAVGMPAKVVGSSK
jgi:serine O-acetyltransferase